MRRKAAALALTAAGLLAASTLAPANASNDPLWDRQWGPQQVRADQAWATSTGAGTVIAVVDSGVDLSHPDLQGKLVAGTTTIGCPKGQTTCGNGDWKGVDGEGQANDAHGTHVAGIAAAATNNGIGIAGVAPDAKIMPVKVLEDGSGDFGAISNGIRYAVDNGADVINLSVGVAIAGYAPGYQLISYTGLMEDTQAAIAYAVSKGVVVVAASGNESFPVCGSPAIDDGVLCVTSTDRRELPAAYSNGAIKPDLQVVAAPGGSLGGMLICDEDILSTVPAGTGAAGEFCGYGTEYDEYAGTSMATPHVAGVAALLVAQGRSAENVIASILDTARTPGADITGLYTPTYGWGIVDAAAAVAAPGGSGGTGGEPTATAEPTATSSPSPTASPSPTKTPKGKGGGGKNG